jgi:hypothetical protein
MSNITDKLNPLASVGPKTLSQPPSAICNWGLDETIAQSVLNLPGPGEPQEDLGVFRV